MKLMDKCVAMPDIAWYLIQCKPRQDGRALEHLSRQGFECFGPTLSVESIKANKLCRTEQPLFPGYLFARIAADGNWTALRSTRGVSRVIGFCGHPCQVDDAIVEQLRTRCAADAGQVVFSPGDKVHIKTGPLADMDAIFLAMDGDERVVLLLNILHREQQVRMKLSHLSV